ncbi:MAG: ferrochelatase [Actinomycetia bacterium]|nr:ferrochelatase [Actinomycetes bacterium]
MTHGLVVMAYGTPSGPEQVEEYYTHIRRGKPPEPRQLAELTARYEAIGGISPMAQRTRAQLDAIESELSAADPGNWLVRLGQKHAYPFIEDAVAELRASAVDRIVGLVLAPHYSAFSVGQYNARAEAAAHTTPFRGIQSWHDLPEFVSFQARALRESLAAMPGSTHVVFTAHSLPERVLVDDPYPDQLHESAQAIAAAAGVSRWAGWGLGWQSAGRTPEPWRGPDILGIIDDLAQTGRSDGLVVVPQGFTSDHLEVLYDLDIEAARAAERAGLPFGRTAVPNDDPAVMGALARLVLATGEQP